MNAPAAAARTVNINVPYPFPRAKNDVVLKRGSPRGSTTSLSSLADTRWDAYNLDSATTRPSPFCREAVLDFRKSCAAASVPPPDFRFGSVCDEFRDHVHCFLAPSAVEPPSLLAPLFRAAPLPPPLPLSVHVMSAEIFNKSVRVMVHGADPQDRGPVYKTPAADGSSGAPDFIAWRAASGGDGASSQFVCMAQADFRRWLDSVPSEQRKTWLRSNTDMFQTDTPTGEELVYDAASRLQYAIVPLEEMPTALSMTVGDLMALYVVLATAASAAAATAKMSRCV